MHYPQYSSTEPLTLDAERGGYVIGRRWYRVVTNGAVFRLQFRSRWWPWWSVALMRVGLAGCSVGPPMEFGTVEEAITWLRHLAEHERRTRNVWQPAEALVVVDENGHRVLGEESPQ